MILSYSNAAIDIYADIRLSDIPLLPLYYSKYLTQYLASSSAL